MSAQEQAEAFWQSYLASLPPGAVAPRSYQAWSFGDNEQDADELGRLARDGTKTATCSLVWAYEAEKEALPAVGDLSVITSWAGEPLCVVETTEVQIKPFHQVDEAFARDEGEGDLSLAYWRKAHWAVFSRECAAIGREPAETMPLLCERFRVLFPRPAGPARPGPW